MRKLVTPWVLLALVVLVRLTVKRVCALVLGAVVEVVVAERLWTGLVGQGRRHAHGLETLSAGLLHALGKAGGRYWEELVHVGLCLENVGISTEFWWVMERLTHVPLV